MKQYKDGLGYIHDVSDECEFERRRGILLKIAIVIKVIIIAAIVWVGTR